MRNLQKRILLFSVFLVAILSLVGCWDAHEPESMVYIHGIGVDYKDDKFIIYLQIINPSRLAKSEATGGTAGSTVVVGRGSGKTLNEAIFSVYHSSQRLNFWGHLSFYVFTEEALKKGGLKATVDLFDRYRETRYNTWIYGTKEPLFELLTALPPLEMSTALSRLADPEPTYKQASFIHPVDLKELIINLNEPPYEAIIPYVRLTPKHTWKSEKKEIKTIQAKGVYSITTDTVKDLFADKEIKGLTWMNKDFTREQISLKIEGADISLLVNKIKVKKKPIIKGKDIHFELSFEIRTQLREIVQRERLKKIEKEAERLIKKQIKETFLEGLRNDVDIYRLSEVLYRRNVNAWKSVQQNGMIPLTEDSLQKIDVDVKLYKGEKQRRFPTLS